MLDHYYAVIMAGEGGTRLWPFSQRLHPKQMIRLGSEKTLFPFPKDDNENIVLEARHIAVDSRNTLVCADRSGSLIVTIGTEDLIVVETLDALLICKRSEAQKVREFVNLLKKSGQNNSYL